MAVAVWPVLLVLASLMEVGGNAAIHEGLRDHRRALVSLGFVILGAYGLVVNLVRSDFSRLMGVYVCFFAVAAVLVSRFVFGEKVPPATWLGLALIVAGGTVIQLGQD